MRAMIANRTEPTQLLSGARGLLEPRADTTTPVRPPHILPYFDDVDSGYLHLRNIDQVRATAHYHLNLRVALARRSDQRAVGE
jgi:hypothetical protein